MLAPTRRPSAAGPPPPARRRAASLLPPLLPGALLGLSGVLLGLTLLTTPAARAGSYGPPAYSGGQCSPPGRNNPGGAYGPLYDDYVYGDYGGASFCYGAATATCSGAIAAAFAWQPADPNNPQGDPPPQSVIVERTCVATGAGACDNGLGDPDVGGVSGYDASHNAIPHYSVQAGGVTAQAPACGASASVTGDSGSGVLSSSVGYAASIYPVTIDLTGQTVDTDGSFQALTGQQITSTFDTHGAPGTISNYNWSTVGGGPIYTYDPTWPNPEFGTQVVPLDYENYLNNPDGSMSYYDVRDKDEVTTKCTATLSPSQTAPPHRSALRPRPSRSRSRLAPG